MTAARIAGPFSVVNGKLMVHTSTARFEITPAQARDRLNELLAAVEGLWADYRTEGCSDPTCSVCAASKAAERALRVAIEKAVRRS